MINRAWAQMFPDPDDRPTRYAVVTDVNSTSPDNLFQIEIVAILE